MVSFDFEAETTEGTENEYSKFDHRMYRSPDHQHAGPGPGIDPGGIGPQRHVSDLGEYARDVGPAKSCPTNQKSRDDAI